jgi:HlyD family secretion protein
MKPISLSRGSRNARLLSFATAACLLTSAIFLFSGCGGKKAKQHRPTGPTSTPVRITTVNLGTISHTVPVTGSLEALQDVSLAARVTARVTAVTVREGDTVHAGEVLVQQDTSDLEETVRQGEANLQNAKAQLAQAETNYQIQIVQSKQTVLNARAAVAAAQYNYSKEKEGSRPQQVLQSQASVEQAKANLNNAAVTLKRDQALYTEGALDAADRDTAQTTYNVDLQTYNNAVASLSLTKAGNYPQDIKYAAEEVKEAQSTLKNDIAGLAQIEVHKQEIQAAKATVAQDEATVAYDKQQVTYATITSPINGIVAERDTEPGQIASTSTTVMRIVNVRTMYYEPTISESDFAETSVGDPVSVTVDALPGKTYSGKVVAIYPAASSSNRVFTLRVNIDDPRYELRPGMFARGRLVTAVHRNVVVIPISALVPVQESLDQESSQGSYGFASGGTSLPSEQVFIAGPGNKAVARPVKTGFITTASAEITSGLKPGDKLITTGQDLVQPGGAIDILNNKQNQPSEAATPSPSS